MITEEMIFGAKAEIYIKYENGIEELTIILSKKFLLNEMRLDTDEEPPHDLVGHGEGFGFQLWLLPSNSIRGVSFCLRIETEHCLQETRNDRMHELSFWIARFVADICDLETLVPDPESKFAYLFKRHVITKINDMSHL